MAVTEQTKRTIGYATLAVGVASLGYLLWGRLGSSKPVPARLRTDAPGWQRSKMLIDKLHPSVQPMAWQVLSRAWDDGLALVVTQSLRTNAEQQALYDQGRTKPGQIVTNALPGSSWHNFGLAFDVAVLEGGVPTWPNNNDLWNRIGNIGKKIGLAWGGDWQKFPDRPHFEFHPGMTLADARAGVRPTGPAVA